MKLIRRFLRTVRFLILLALFAGAGLWLFLENAHWGYARAVSSDEQTLRGSVVSVAEGWLGANEADGTHREIIDLYNAQDVLAQDYEVKYSDNWCAAFASAVAIQCDLTDKGSNSDSRRSRGRIGKAQAAKRGYYRAWHNCGTHRCI